MRQSPDITPEIVSTRPRDFPETAAHRIINTVYGDRVRNIIFPSGNTPLNVYTHLARDPEHDPCWQHVSYISLDEYAGLASDDHRRLDRWIARAALDPLKIPEAQRLRFEPDGPVSDRSAECTRMEKEIAGRGGIDLAILGLGQNGHIGFNEPGSAFDSRTRLVNLAPSTIKANAAYWGGNVDAVPKQAFTLGLGTLLEARRIILLVTGATKAEILNAVIEGDITPDVPATALRTHPHVTIIADTAALEGG